MKSAGIFLLLLVTGVSMAQSQKRVWFDANDPMASYFSSALEKKKVPVIVTADRSQADYIVTFQETNSNGSMVQGIMSAINSKGKDYDPGAFNETSIRVIDPRTQDVVFSYTCKKPTNYAGDDNSRGSSVAECLAKHWKNKLGK